MGKISLIRLIISLIPCVVMAIKAVGEAKEDDGEIDSEEIGEIIGKVFNCVAGKMGWDV